MAGQAKERPTWSWKKRTAVVIPMTAPAWAIALAVCALLLATPAQAAVFVVNSTVDSVDALPGDAVCADASGACTLRAAVMETNALSGADVIHVPAGTYVLALPGTGEHAAATGDLDVTDDLILLGAGADRTIIDAAGIDRVLSITGASLSVHSLTITGGLSSDLSGGGILCFVCDRLSVNKSKISGNAAEGSGGSFFWYGSGGGVALLAAQQPAVITSTTISGNQAQEGGGGVYVDRSYELTIRESSISENIAASNGGGVWNNVGTVTLLNSTVSGNVGAGVTSRCWGEKGSCEGGDTAVYSSAVSGNTGGGLDAGWAGEFSSLFALQNSVIADQASGSDCTGEGTWSAGHNLDSDGTCDLTDPSDLPNTDPMLGVLQDNGGPTFTHALLPGSPAINAIPLADCAYDDDGDPGTPEVPLPEDQRGVARPQGDGCDIGAYEVTACADGIDNDGDTFIDADDPGCPDAASVREDPQCQDGVNNDPGQDDLIDFDGGLSALGYVATDPDPQCVGKPWRNNEFRQPSCGLGVELTLLLSPLLWFYWSRRRSSEALSL